MYAPLINTIRDLKSRIANNPDYGWSVASSYTMLATNIVIQLALIPFYLAYLGKVQFGILMIALGAINYLGFGVSWVTSGAQRLIGEMSAQEDTAGLERVYGLVKILFLLYALLTAALGVGIVYMLQDRLFPSDPGLAQDTVQMVILGAAYMVALYDLNVNRLILIAVGKQTLANLLTIVSQIAFVILVIPALIYGWGLPGVMAAFLAGVVLTLPLSVILIRREHLRPRMPRYQERGILGRLIGPMGLGYALYGVLMLTLLQADTLLLGALGGPALVADFVLIWKAADLTMQALWRLPDSLVPYLIRMDVKGEHERLRAIYATGSKWMMGLGALSAITFAAFGYDILLIWLGEENAPDLPWAYALAGGALFWMTVARLPVIYAFSTVRLKPLVGVAALEATSRVVMLFTLFPMYGLYAPLIATNIVHILGVAYLYQRLAKSVFRQHSTHQAQSKGPCS